MSAGGGNRPKPIPVAPIAFGEQLTDPQQILAILKNSFHENDEDGSGGLVTP